MTLLCALAHISAQNTYTARVVDATTGDALPMASVYISSSHSTITNQEGDFSIKAHPEDMLHITYVGYNGKNIKASDLGRKVALKPYTRLLKEVTDDLHAQPRIRRSGLHRHAHARRPRQGRL